jgi:hypothetical protein
MDYVLNYMRENKLPLTRKVYLEMAFPGRSEELDPLDGEEESMLPPEFQKKSKQSSDPENEDFKK